MSFLTKALSKVGIGAAKVDAVLDNACVEPGQVLTGTIHIEGGKAEQEINKIDLDVYCEYIGEVTDSEGETTEITRTHRLTSWDIQEAFTIGPGDSRQIPFEIPLDEFTPLSIGKSRSWLTTNLDIDFALDKSDKDYLTVEPNPLQKAVFDGLTQLGFTLREAENEESSFFGDLIPFIQEFEFKPAAGEFRGKLDEVEVVFAPSGDTLTVYLEIDRRARGFSGMLSEMFGTDETKVYINVDKSNIDDITDILYNVISEHS